MLATSPSPLHTALTLLTISALIMVGSTPASAASKNATHAKSATAHTAATADTMEQRPNPTCEPSSTTIAVSPDNAAATITHSDNEVSIDADALRRVDLKRCSVRVTFTAKPGYRVAVNKIDHRGYVNLPARARFELWTTLHTGPNWAWWNQNTFLHRQIGSVDDDFTVTHTIPRSRLRWGPCGRPSVVTVTTTMWLNARRAADEHTFASLDSTDLSTIAQTGTRMGLLWQRC